MLHPMKHAQFNRQPVRLEFAVSPTKQTPATQFNRQQSATPRNTNCSHESQVTNHESRIAASLLDTNGRLRQNNKSRNSFKTNDRANSYSIQMATLPAKRITAGSLSNRHSVRLENAISCRKQALASRSNRHKNALSGDRNRPRNRPSPITRRLRIRQTNARIAACEKHVI